MIVAVRSVTVVQVAGNQEVAVIGVRNGFVTATRCVLVAGLVPVASVRLRASGRIRGRDLEDVLVDVAFVHVVEMAVVQIVDVIGVPDFRMGALRAVFVRVRVVGFMCHIPSIPRL